MERRVRRRSNKRLFITFAIIIVVIMVAEYFVIAALQPNVEDIVSQKVQEALAMSTPNETESAPPPTAAPAEDVATQPTPTAQPTPTTEPNPGEPALPISLDKLYTEEDEGEEIKFIQQMLIDLGFNPGAADGIFGVKLSAAIMEFQMYAKIDADGKAGPDTLSLMLEKWEASQEETRADDQPLKGLKIGLDPGHQEQSNADLEPRAPGSSTMKKKVSSGTYGRFTGVYEYVVNLQVGLRLKRELEALGAQVIMTRETHDVDISNAERATMMNEEEVDCWLRIHANGSNIESVHGMFMLIPQQGSMHTTDRSIAVTSEQLGKVLIDAAMESTGADSPKSKGLSVRDDQTGFSWSSVPVCNIEMGHMTNEREDWLLITEAYQILIVEGLVEGFVEYYSQAE